MTAPNGQLDGRHDVELRGRDASGHLIAHLGSLRELIAGIGADCWASGPTAAALHRFDGWALRPPFHVIVPAGHNLARVGHVVATSNCIPLIDREMVAGVPVLSPTRTLLVLAATVTREQLTVALDSALRDRSTTEDFLHRRIAALRRSGRSGIGAMLSVIEGSEITRGGQSWLEREFLRLVGEAGLPRPETQVVLGRRRDSLIRVDVRWPGTPIVVEVLGYRFHRTSKQLLGDVERMNRLLLLGYRVVQFTYTQIVEDPREVIATLRAAMATFAA